ncbi:unnamed protein product [Parascedosporium putredinis]|uniref:Uncharacterized protein n=1 Tax=Parascedosporium putredinis TaxID=1442378 RepID=A0A9P1H0R3_9PEZI|nr:unnamed protein product [Parascedosporium putredinis]CAI7994207.1 unnamed protein product [Parascedosporium putredinis]
MKPSTIPTFLLGALSLFAPFAAAKLPSVEDFGYETNGLAENGLCRNYLNTYIDGLTTCDTYCTAKGNHDGFVGCETVREGSKDTGNKYTRQDPEGNLWALGRCICETPGIVKVLVENFALAMPAFGSVTCSVWFEVGGQVLKAGISAIPTTGISSRILTALIQGAKTANKFGGSYALDFYQQWYEGICGTGPWTEEIQDMFNILSYVDKGIEALEQNDNSNLPPQAGQHNQGLILGGRVANTVPVRFRA